MDGNVLFNDTLNTFNFFQGAEVTATEDQDLTDFTKNLQLVTSRFKPPEVPRYRCYTHLENVRTARVIESLEVI